MSTNTRNTERDAAFAIGYARWKQKTKLRILLWIVRVVSAYPAVWIHNHRPGWFIYGLIATMVISYQVRDFERALMRED